MASETGRKAMTTSVSMSPELFARAMERVKDLSPRVSSFSNYVQQLIATDIESGVELGNLAHKLYYSLNPVHTALSKSSGANLPSGLAEEIDNAEERLDAVRQVLYDIGGSRSTEAALHRLTNSPGVAD